jgi:cytochrome c
VKTGVVFAFTLCLMAGTMALAAGPVRPKTSGLADQGVQRGAQIYADQCTSCHGMDENRYGPISRGVFGRKAGTAPGYDYTKQLRQSGLVWDAATLERWLTNPRAVLPNTRMDFKLDKAQDRADVIAYLKTQGAK